MQSELKKGQLTKWALPCLVADCMAKDTFRETCYINRTPVETNGEIWKKRGALGNLGCNINKWKQFFPVAISNIE